MEDDSYPTTIELKGNELAWIIKLAENYFLGDKFLAFIEKYNLTELRRTLGTKLGIFRFIPLSAQQTWVISLKEIDETQSFEQTHQKVIK